MAFSFPASPTAGQTSIQNGRTYKWSGYAWELAVSSGGSGSVDVYEFATTVNFPATGASAVIYIATDTGRTYRWTGSLYVEVGSTGGVNAITITTLGAAPARSGYGNILLFG
jgi:hypothetical protein